MIVDYLVFKPEYARELCEMWESTCGETQLPAYFEERQTECAFTDGELVGCALFESREGIAWCRLAVREDSRGCGVGRRLLVNLCQRAKARGCASVLVWGVPKGDRTGIALLADEEFRRGSEKSRAAQTRKIFTSIRRRYRKTRGNPRVLFSYRFLECSRKL